MKKVNCFVNKKQLNLEDNNKLNELINRINEMKKILIKTPVQTEMEFH